MDLDQIIDNIGKLPEPSKNALKEIISEVTHPKGHILFRADKVETKVYFIKKGIVRAYTELADNEITFWFGREGDTVVSMKSYVSNQRGYENIELLEECELYEVRKRALHELFCKDIHIANWGREFAEKELLKTEERFIGRQFKTSLERYRRPDESYSGSFAKSTIRLYRFLSWYYTGQFKPYSGKIQINHFLSFVK